MSYTTRIWFASKSKVGLQPGPGGGGMYIKILESRDVSIKSSQLWSNHEAPEVRFLSAGVSTSCRPSPV